MSPPASPITTPPASLFPALGPVGSVVTSIVLAAAAAAAGWLASKGYIAGADQTQISGLIAAVLAAIGAGVYKAISARMSAKITAVAASPDVAAVVTTSAVANSPAHIDDAKVVSPRDAAAVISKA